MFPLRQRPPPDAPPPAYSLQRFLPLRTRRTNLRTVVLVIAFFSAIWSIVVGAAYLRARNRDALPSKVQLIYLVLAILYFVCTAIELFGLAAAYRASIKLVRLYFWSSALAAAIVSTAEILRTITHFAYKDDIIKSCVASYASDVNSGVYSSSEISSYCKDSWSNSSYIDIALLIFTFLVSFFFASVAASYLHQLKNPGTLRTQVAQAASSQYAYPLRPFDSHLGGGAGPVPPYPEGQQPLPSYDNPYGVSASEEKFSAPPPSNGQYAPPPGPPPSHAAGAHENPFADQVEHVGSPALVRRPGETADEFEQRQHEHDLQQQERQMRPVYGSPDADRDAFASTETVTLEPRSRGNAV
ncbi:hypothetical protein BMF94_0087 [Rhodotorula taiwanensis]|uniref:MARVEL domain-containing protein n=1 Tax=Rhodotorula taiwanensis TaxID=741276 RepID=A0A2S5BJ84_9BASI|nr:hypothetical protein BMF94_0087 [Rhodotorula taiwanensis]